MHIQEYQDDAREYVAFDEENPMQYLLPALAEEVGELQGIFAKNFRKHGDYGLNIAQLEEVRSELGDVLWNVAMIAEFNMIDLDTVAFSNLLKLSNRKEQGTIASIQR